MWVCVACGKSFDRGARILPPDRAYCPECAKELDGIVQEFEIAWMEAKLFGKTKPDVDEHLRKHEATLSKLKIDKMEMKHRLLRTVLSIERERVL